MLDDSALLEPEITEIPEHLGSSEPRLPVGVIRRERLHGHARPPAPPPTSLAAAVDRLSYGAGDASTAPATRHDEADRDHGATVVKPAGPASARRDPLSACRAARAPDGPLG